MPCFSLIRHGIMEGSRWLWTWDTLHLEKTSTRMMPATISLHTLLASERLETSLDDDAMPWR